MKNNERAQTIEGAAYRIKQGFAQQAGYDKADVVVELVGLIDYLANANKPRKYDSTVARIAGNLLSGNPYVVAGGTKAVHRLLDGNGGMLSQGDQDLVSQAVMVARAIVAETIRTEPEGETRDE